MTRPRLPLGDYVQLLLKHDLLVTPATPLSADLTAPVEAVTCDSRSALPGSLFLCKGAAFREEYLTEALHRGAMAYVSEQVYPVSAPCIQVTSIRSAMGLLADLAWGHPSGKIPVIGLTGTKGKTTTAYFLKSILDSWREKENLHPVGLLSTIVTDDGVLRRPAVLTTPEPLELQRHLWNAETAGCGYVVMECSSQALKYGRMTGVELEAGVFLNLGEDHISPKEHPDLEDYFSSKLKIFQHAKTAVVNLDSDRAGEILSAAKPCRQVITYSLTDSTADLFAETITRTAGGMEFTLSYGGKTESFFLPMTGAFNVSNALAALAVCQLLIAPADCIRTGLAAVRVPGRMETYSANGKTVVVDYAHNGMALEALLRSLREDYPASPLTVVFGCTGGKGLDRREGMGKAAAKWADTIILTEDDPGSERVEDICAEIGSHISPKPYTVLPDREEAICTAISTAPAGGVVVLAGKGNESTQKRANGGEPCVPDGLLAQKYLNLL